MKNLGKRITAILLTLCLIAAAGLAAPASAATVKAAGEAVSIDSCRIEGGNVVVRATAAAIPQSDDGLFHLIAQEVYQGGADGTEVAVANASSNPQFSLALNRNTQNSNLYKKFLVAMKIGGAMVPVSLPKFITNPEAVATHTTARSNPGKKGILPAAALLDKGNSIQELGVKQCVYNLRLGDLMRDGTVPYQYNGKTYYFNRSVLDTNDYAVTRLNLQGAQVTMVLLNNLNGDASMLHPLSRGGSANYYAFNTAEQAGVERLEAIASFLAQRYSGTGHGVIENWVIGNEINARADWHYMSAVSLTTFTNEYANAVRIFYNGIKSENASARIYVPIDQQWTESANASKYYPTRDFLDVFNTIISSSGNIDWHVAMHPYNVPLQQPAPWAASSKILHDVNTPYISMQNIDVLTDYLSQPVYLAPNGQVRSVLCTEVGYTSLQGEELQAAAVVYGYLQAMANQHIDGFILTRELDDAGEIAGGLANGLVHLNGAHKMSYEFYKHIDKADGAKYEQTAAALVGLPGLRQFITTR